MDELCQASVCSLVNCSLSGACLHASPCGMLHVNACAVCRLGGISGCCRVRRQYSGQNQACQTNNLAHRPQILDPNPSFTLLSSHDSKPCNTLKHRLVRRL